MSEDLKAPFVATLKAGKDFDSPWLVVSSNTAEDLVRRLNEAREAALTAAIANAAIDMQGTYNVARGTGPVEQVASTPQQSAVAPLPADRQRPANARCKHGQYIWKEGNNKQTGRPYAGWFCPSREHTDCAPVWPRR